MQCFTRSMFWMVDFNAEYNLCLSKCIMPARHLGSAMFKSMAISPRRYSSFLGPYAAEGDPPSIFFL